MPHLSGADEAYDRILPQYRVWERAVREAAPELPDDVVLDRALRSTLAELHFELSRETVAFVRRRLSQAGAIPRDDDQHSRSFTGTDGQLWSVREVVAGNAPSGQGPRCLVFSSEMVVRRVWRYPTDWRGLPDADLEALSWGP